MKEKELELLSSNGTTADIYIYDEEHILKVYRDNISEEVIEREYKCTKAVQDLGINVPKLDGRIIWKGKHAIILEYIKGKEISLLSHETDYEKTAKTLAELHYKIHCCKGGTLEKAKVRFARQLTLSKKDLGKYYEKLMNLLYEQPDIDALCHNDFHSMNLIIRDSGPCIIDWSDATSGDPYSDVARTYMMFAGDWGAPEQFSKEIVARMKYAQKIIGKVYTKEYCRISGITLKEFERRVWPWNVIVQGSRMYFDYEENKPISMGFIKNYFDGKLG